ncbi:hydroxyproline-rich glycoprotein family protein [Trifolium repens]|nr:hydroxyproline-rich glycoprotein family protein [Trifolium repens]
MEQEEETSTMSPFWVPKTTTNHHRLRRTYSLLQTTTSFLVLLIITTIVLTFIVVPTLKSFTSNIFKPQTIKHSWDYLNLILVLFAVVCGFLTKNDTNETQTPRFDSYNNNNNHRRSFSNPETPPSWYDDSNRSFNRLRAVGSVPDLRQRTVFVADDDRYRFYDDTSVHFRYRNLRFEDELNRETVTSGEVYRQSLPDSRIEDVRRNVERIYEVETVEKSEINDDDSVAENLYSPPSPPPQPLPAVRKKKSRSASKENTATVNSVEFSSPVPELNLHPLPAVIPVVRRGKSRSGSKEDAVTAASVEFFSPVLESEEIPQPSMMRTKGVRRNVKPTYQSEMIENLEHNDFVVENSQLPPSVVVAASPLRAERKIGIPVKKKRGNATKEFLASLRGKKKKQRQKSVGNFESIQNSQPSPIVSQPPPPPPPPPPSVFHSLFSSNKSKHKKHYHVPVATYKPQLTNKREQSHYRLKENVVITGNESPLIPIPPPPPPPPFKLPAWKFRVQGDYVRVDSIGSSRSGSPDPDEVVESPISQCSNSPYAEDGEERRVTENGNASAASLFCPSPDVDTKAQNFIQNFRAGLRMAKMNSMREKQGIGMSNLGKSLS